MNFMPKDLMSPDAARHAGKINPGRAAQEHPISIVTKRSFSEKNTMNSLSVLGKKRGQYLS